MTDILCQGYHVARDAGLLQDGCTIVLALVLPDFVADADDVNVDDTNIASAEYDGAGYSRHVAATVTWQYDATDDEMQLDFDDDDEAFGTTVVAASEVPAGIAVILQVGGSPSASADYILGFNDSGSYGNGNNGALGIIVPAGGLMFSKQA
jgi:hypothetical protein